MPDYEVVSGFVLDWFAQLYEDATMIDTTINHGGYLMAYSGTLSRTTINSAGSLSLQGGKAISTIVNSGGYISVQPGGMANYTTVNYGGSMYIGSGGTATNIDWTPGIGEVCIAQGAEASFVNPLSGVYLVSGDRLLSSATVMSKKAVTCEMYVMSGGTAVDTTVKDDAEMVVWSGGRAYNTTLLDAMDVSSGGLASGVKVNDGRLSVYAGASAMAVSVTSCGKIKIDPLASISDVKILAGGRVNAFTLQKGTTLNSAAFHISSAFIKSGNQGSLGQGQSATCVTVQNGARLKYSDVGSVKDLTVEVGGIVNGFSFGNQKRTFADGSSISNARVEAYSDGYIIAGQNASNITVEAGGRLFISGGGTTVSNISFHGYGEGYPHQWDICPLEFDLRGKTEADDCGIHGLWSIQGDSGWFYHRTYITVDAAQSEGVYFLVDDANSADLDVVSFQVYDGGSAHDLQFSYSYYDSVATATYGSTTYTLKQNSGNTYLVVEQQAGVLSVTADITGPTTQNVTVSAAFSSKTAVREYSLNGGSWQNYTGGVVMNDNGTVYFRGGDGEGYYSDAVSYTVSNIDRTAPQKPSVNAVNSGYKVMVTATFSDDSEQKQYSLDDQNWNHYDSGVLMGANGTVYFRGIDAAGNISEVTSYTVDNIEIPENVYIVTNADDGKLDLAYSGKYTLTGEFGDITGTVTVLNGGKKAGTGTIKNGVLTFNKGNPILLDSSLATEVEVTIKKGTNTNYSVSLNPQSLFTPNDGDSQSSPRQLGTVTAAGPLVNDGWVGFGDESDHLAFTLDHAASLSLDLTSTDAAKFTLINAATGKTVLNSSLKAGTAITTKAKLLEAGQYYLQVKSTNAKKGGDASYTVSVNPGTTFFTQGGDNNDSWQTAEPAGDLQVGAKVGSGWVGFGDVYDFKSVTLNTSARLKFTVDSSDAVKFTVYQLNNGKLKALGNVSVKAKATGTTKDIFVTAGTYYLSVQSTNAKKGGNADYSVTLDGSSKIFPAGDNTNDTWQAASRKTAKLQGEEITGWVGYGDAKDFIRFQLNGDGQIQLDLNSVTADAWSAKQIKLTCLDAKGKSVALSALDSDTLVSKKAVAAGEYYLGVTCANVKKFDTSYSVTTGLLA